MYNWTLPVFTEKLSQSLRVTYIFHSMIKKFLFQQEVMFTHVEWDERGSASSQFAWTHAAETKAKKTWRVHSWHLESLLCKPSRLKPCQNLPSKLLPVLHFQITDRQVISVMQPLPNIQVAWKLVSEAVSFSRCNVLVFVVQEQSEGEKMILVLLFHPKVLWDVLLLHFL